MRVPCVVLLFEECFLKLRYLYLQPWIRTKIIKTIYKKEALWASTMISLGQKLYLKLWFVGEVTWRSCMLLKSSCTWSCHIGSGCWWKAMLLLWQATPHGTPEKTIESWWKLWAHSLMPHGQIIGHLYLTDICGRGEVNLIFNQTKGHSVQRQ